MLVLAFSTSISISVIVSIHISMCICTRISIGTGIGIGTSSGILPPLRQDQQTIPEISLPVEDNINHTIHIQPQCKHWHIDCNIVYRRYVCICVCACVCECTCFVSDAGVCS